MSDGSFGSTRSNNFGGGHNSGNDYSNHYSSSNTYPSSLSHHTSHRSTSRTNAHNDNETPISTKDNPTSRNTKHPKHPAPPPIGDAYVNLRTAIRNAPLPAITRTGRRTRERPCPAAIPRPCTPIPISVLPTLKETNLLLLQTPSQAQA